MKFLTLAAAFSLFLALNVRADEPAAPAGGEGKKGDHHHPTKEEILKKFDKDGDGKLNDEEKAAAKAAGKAAHEAEMLKKFDKDGDGKLSDEEKAAMPKRGKGKGKPEGKGEGKPESK